MNSILVRSIPLTSPASTSSGRILAIEPDAERARQLRDLFREHATVDLQIVTRTSHALRAMADRVPDLVITSTFLPPAEEVELAAQVRQRPDALHVQIISVPYFIDADQAPVPESAYSNVLRFLTRRQATIRPQCDTATLRRQIEEYLAQAVAARREQEAAAAAGVEDAAILQLDHAASAIAVLEGSPVSAAVAEAGQSDRRRARRRRGDELPSLWTVRLPWGSDVKVVDISSRGVLLESASRIPTGSTVDLRLLGEDTNVFVPARLVRAEVAGVDTLGVKYRLGAAFSRELDLAGLEPAVAAAPTARTLAELLTRVLAHADGPAGSASLRGRFESELKQLLHLRDLQIRESPVIAEQGAESIYFTLPGRSSCPRILQAIYEPGYAPSPVEFRLLKAAASLAAVVLELAAPADVPLVERRVHSELVVQAVCR
jgi:hypothetical protein